jgi:hypothetical protein
MLRKLTAASAVVAIAGFISIPYATNTVEAGWIAMGALAALSSAVLIPFVKGLEKIAARDRIA